MEDNMNNNPNTGEKTFTQEDVNRIVGERLAKEKAKGEHDFGKREQELALRELRLTAKETLNEKGLPVYLIDALNCSSKEALENSISAIEQVFKEYKKETPAVLRGVTPNMGGRSLPPNDPDVALRKAMGLPK